MVVLLNDALFYSFLKYLLYAYPCVTLWWVKTFSYIYWEHGIYGLTEDFQILVGIFIFGGSSFFILAS